GDLVQVDEPDRAVGDRPRVDHAAPVGEQRVDRVLVTLGRDRRMLFAGGVEAADALVHVPAEGADHPDVVVVRHLAVGDHVEAGLFLVVDHDLGGVVVGLLVADLLERDSRVAAEQLLRVPVGARVRADHRGRENGVDDRARGHGWLLVFCSRGPFGSLRLRPQFRVVWRLTPLQPMCRITEHGEGSAMNIASRGARMAVDGEQRVDYDRLRRHRMARAKASLEASDLGALLLFDPNNLRYLTSTAIGTWERDKNIRFALLPRGEDPILWDFGSAA